MRILTSIALVFLAFSSYATTVEEVLTKVKDAQSNTKELAYRSTYQLFKGHKSNEVHTSYEGYLYRKGKQVYQRIDDVEFIYGEDYYLHVSHREKAMMLDVQQKAIQVETDIQQLLAQCSEKELRDKEDYYEIVLWYKHAANSPFGVVKLRVEKESFSIRRMDLYYSHLQDFSVDYKQQDLQRPHLRILFDEVNPDKETKGLFDFSKYLHKKQNKLIPAGSCSGYELIDNRIK